MKQKQDGSVWENSQKNEQGEKRRRVARRDRFQRIKNRKEPLYRMPAFLKHTIGCVEISESGIILGTDGFSKVYALKTDMKIFCPKLRKQEITYDVFYEAEKRYLLIHYAGRNLEEAYLWFARLSTPVEWKKTFAMFGLMGNAQRRFHNLLPSDSVAEITEHGFEKKENASYDIEEMRKLFFEKGATE